MTTFSKPENALKRAEGGVSCYLLLVYLMYMHSVWTDIRFYLHWYECDMICFFLSVYLSVENLFVLFAYFWVNLDNFSNLCLAVGEFHMFMLFLHHDHE